MGRPRKDRKVKDPNYSPTRDDSDMETNRGSNVSESEDEKAHLRNKRKRTISDNRPSTSENLAPTSPANKSVATTDPCKCPLCLVIQRRGGIPIHDHTPLHWKKINKEYDQLFQILYEMDTQRIGNGSQPLCISKPTGVLRCPLCGWEFEKVSLFDKVVTRLFKCSR